MRLRGAGHTLLEVFLAMILLSFIIFAAVSLYPGCMLSLTRSHQMSVASNLAQQYLEQTRAHGYAASVGPITDTIDTVDYQTTITVLPPPSVNIQRLSVTVTWNTTSNVTLTTDVFQQVNNP